MEVSSAPFPGWVPLNNQVAVLGDSITAQNFASAPVSAARGYMTQAQAMSMGRFVFNYGLDFGVPSETTTQILVRVPTVIAAQPGRVAYMGGGNDIFNSVAKETILANILTAAAMFEAAGIPMDVLLITPFNAAQSGITLAQRQAQRWVNEGLLRAKNSRNPKFYNVIDTFTAMVDQNNATSDPITGAVASDGRHPVGYGAQLLAQPISTFYNGIFPAPIQRYDTQDSTYDATNNPYGSIFPNPALIGTAGTVGTGASGVVANNMTLQRTVGSTLTLAGSKVAQPAPGNGTAMVITLGGTAGVANEFGRFISSSLALTNVPVGTQLVAEFDVETSGLANVCNIRCDMSESGTGGLATGLGGTGLAGDREIAACRRIITSPPITTGSTANLASISLVINADCLTTSGGVAGVITIRSARMRVY